MAWSAKAAFVSGYFPFGGFFLSPWIAFPPFSSPVYVIVTAMEIL